MKQKIKIIICSMLLIIIAGLFVMEIKTFSNKSITYSKTSNVSLITHLKDNNYYKSTYLKNEYNVVANLVDYFNIDYNYSYALPKKINYELNYNIKAVLEVYDSDDSEKPIDKLDFVIEEDKKVQDSGQVIKVDMINEKILYQEYNKIVENWKKEISPKADLRVSINVAWSGTNDEIKQQLSDNNLTEFVIPISQKTINIKIPSNINETGKIKLDNKIPTGYIIMMLSTLLMFVIVLICLLIIITSNNKEKSKYEQKINKILREFDRAITEAKGKFAKVRGENYIEVMNFMELLDVHDNLNKPIIYYKNSDNLSIFVVKNGKDNYYSKIKRSDFDN